MKIPNFINKAIDNYQIEWSTGKHNGKEGYFIKCPVIDTMAHFSNEAIKNNDWSTLKGEIHQGKNISHMTRIVGYYSKVSNWNKSKKGELKDRQAGDYKIGVSNG